MALPTPNLDDRRFQDLVDDAKRLVQQRCPEWTDHNVSDPGVTLIEAFAYMTDQLIYRLNRVPDRHYVRFLDLIGVRLFPPMAARAPLTFYLSAPQPDTVRIAAGTRAATVRTETDEAIVFSTLEDLAVVACSLSRVATSAEGAPVLDRSELLEKGTPFEAFSPVPQPGDALLIGLSDAVPSCAVALSMRCSIEGVGVDPTRPPIVWEAWTGDGWTGCDLESDSTGGLNRDGRVVLHVPAGHVASLVNRARAGWLRARVISSEADVPAYSASPRIHGVAAETIGGTAAAVNAQPVGGEHGGEGGLAGEILGVSAGVPGQRFALLHRPVVPGEHPPVLRVSETDEWVDWEQVPDFSSSGPADRHFVLDAVAGAVLLGPGVRQPDGTFREYGRVPPKGARLRLDAYMTGGGRHGNVAAGAISVLKSTIPFVARVSNRRPASGGVDGEEIENAKLRGPISLRTRGRAVTTEDYEQIVLEAAPEIARVRAVAATAKADQGGVRVLVVPHAADQDGRLLFERLVPAEETLARITTRLDECRVIGARVVVEPPDYRGITVVAKIQPKPRTNPARLQAAATRALYEYFNPITGGPDGGGWPFGRPVQVGEVYAVLQAVPGTALVEDVRLFGADPITGQRGSATQRLDLEPNSLVFSYEHQLMVEGA
ncbi:MAG: putative baseplate assembly protein [Candidatus Limnocylindrales bacterium]|jgi:predicted phage baseplate assembly protein